nr:MAG TPA: hypothetical protein [Caudoviricetes sp.]DAH34709.1 MAG TPA: hypothetical protein [Caudoviricetes sp.]
MIGRLFNSLLPRVENVTGALDVCNAGAPC